MKNREASYLIRWQSSQATGSAAWIWNARQPWLWGAQDQAWMLEKSGTAFRARSLAGSGGRILNFDHRLVLSDGVLEVSPLEDQSWSSEQISAWSESFFSQVAGEKETEFSFLLKRILGAVTVFLIAIWGYGHFQGLSTPQVDEQIIPPQFAKVLLKPRPATPAKGSAFVSAPGSAGSPSEKAAKSAGGSAAQKVAQAPVVKAFRSKAFQSSVRGLLRGGMTALLAAEGKLLAGDSRHEAAQLFDRAAQGNIPTAPMAGGQAHNVQVALLGGGGSGSGGQGRSGVGYGAGQVAHVTGQGQSFVSLDLPNGQVEEGLTKDEVGKVIHAHISEVRYCYESSMLRAPDLEGKLVLDFTIGGSGGVKTAAVKESSLNDPRLDDCILRRLTKWSFPKPNGGVDVAVSYPFIFKALAR